MNQSAVGSPNGLTPRTWRWGIGLGLLVLLYLAAVITFIIVY